MSDFNKQAVLNQFATHLRFLGYEVNVENEVIFAEHPNKSNIILFVYSNGTMMKALFRAGNDATRNRQAYLELLNQLNTKSLVTRYYADNDSDLVYEAFFSGEYSQASFAHFLDLWDADFQNLMGIDGLERFLS
jgi:hypothetical protein